VTKNGKYLSYTSNQDIYFVNTTGNKQIKRKNAIMPLGSVIRFWKIISKGMQFYLFLEVPEKERFTGLR
jgi:hypothetical protein